MIIAIVILILALLVISIKLSNLVLKPTKSSIENELRKNEDLRQAYMNYEKIDKTLSISHKNFNEDVLIQATIIFRDNLKKEDLQKVQNKEKVVILSHGFGSNRIGVLKYIEIFREKGYNICIYDHRNSANSGGKYTTMGYKERYDLHEIIKECKNIFGQETKIGVFGESMGASTALMLTELEENLEFIVADCGYSVLQDELSYQLKKQYRLPRFPFVQISSFITKIRSGFLYSDIKPIDTISKHGLNVPILFIHGDKDKFTPTYMSEDMYKKRKEAVNEDIITKLYIAPNSGHAVSFLKNKKDYKLEVHKFLDEIDNINMR